ncbi:MAG: DUF1176 domain-containing protein [Sphingomonadaceae bacterium]|nr:DUF1176 domain-containing protein [Sphingomonadaceae bacterium]
MIDLLFALTAAAQNPPTNSEPAPEPGTVRIFGDWAVGCDNGWACEAISLPSEDWGVGNDASLTVRRAGGADGYLRIGARLYEELDPDTIALHIDGRHVATLTDSGDGERYEIDSGMARVVLPQIAEGGSAAIHGPAGEHLFDLSLAGSSAAMRFVDDRQQRAGTRGAAVAIGTRPTAGVVEPPPVPVIRAMPVAARTGETAAPLPIGEAGRLHEARECDGFDDQLRRNEAFVLSDARDLILISCSAGAYNFSDIAYVRDADGAISPARFDRVFAWGEDSEIPLLVNVFWDETANELGTYAKGRGIGDCGTAERFVWDGAMFRLIERREMNSCRGSPHWITVWRANVEWVEP